MIILKINIYIKKSQSKTKNSYKLPQTTISNLKRASMALFFLLKII